jgi:hypothetical protein
LCCSIAAPAGVQEESISKGLARVSDDGGDRIHGRGALGSAETTVLMSVEVTFEALAKGKGLATAAQESSQRPPEGEFCKHAQEALLRPSGPLFARARGS